MEHVPFRTHPLPLNKKFLILLKILSVNFSDIWIFIVSSKIYNVLLNKHT